MAEVIEAEEVTPPPPAKKASAKKSPAKKANVVTEAPAVAEPEAEVVEEATIVEPAARRGRVKGTWRMHFAGQTYDFVDGENYELPQDLYDYLRGMGNIYDTTA